MKLSPIYTALLAGISFGSFAETHQPKGNLEKIDVVTEVERFKATDKLKSEVNLSLLGKQLAFTSPITVVNYDEKAFADSEPRNVVDALAKTDASVMNFGGETNTLQGIYVRGLQLDARQFSVNGLAGLYSTYNSPTSAVSSAQLIKGASTATVGMDPEGSSGASINIETKRATDKDINTIGFTWFSNNRLQESFDFGRRFGANKEWGVRINGKYRDGETARINYDERNKELAIGLDYRGEKLRVGIDYIYAKRATNGGRARIQDIQNLSYSLPHAPNGDINLIPAWSGQTTDDQTIMATFEYDLPYNMTISGGIGHLVSKYYGSFGQILATDITPTGNYKISQLRAMDYINRTTSGNLKLHGYLSTAGINHNWNISLDAVARERDFDQGNVMRKFSAGNIYAPIFAKNSPEFTVPKQGNTDQILKSYSLALADTLSFMEDRLHFTLGGRFQWIKQENYTTNTTTGIKSIKTDAKSQRFSPMLTLAWVPNADMVVYGNYLEDLEPGSVDEDGNMAKPIVSRQIEVGVRKNWNAFFTTTLSAYQIARPGTITAKAAANNLGKVGEEQGKERNRGIEFNIYANLFDNTLRPSLGITYNKGDLIDYANYAGVIISGAQVASPRIMAKANVEWDTSFIRNLTLNAAIQYYGKSYQDYAKNYAFPAYTTVDLGSKYSIKLGNNQQVILRAGIENLFNKSYWQVQRGKADRSFAVVGMPRTYWAKIEYSF